MALVKCDRSPGHDSGAAIYRGMGTDQVTLDNPSRRRTWGCGNFSYLIKGATSLRLTWQLRCTLSPRSARWSSTTVPSAPSRGYGLVSVEVR